MRGLILGLLSVVLLVVSGSYGLAAGKGAAKKKGRTVKEFVEFAVKNGDPEVLPERFVRPVGFDREISTKDITYSNDVAPDKASHAFYLVYADSARLKPIALLWTRLTVEKNENEKISHWSIFRTSISGSLEAACIYSGDVKKKELDSTPLNESTRSLFEIEKNFFLKTAVALPINK